MKKILLFIFTLICVQALAQRKETDPYNSKAISWGPELILPSKTDFKYGVGAQGKIEWPLTDLVSLNLSAGYGRMYYKVNYNEFGTVGPYTDVLLKVGARFFLDPDLYCDVDAGITAGLDYDKKKTQAIDLGLGYLFPLTNHTGLDVGFRFEDWGK